MKKDFIIINPDESAKEFCRRMMAFAKLFFAERQAKLWIIITDLDPRSENQQALIHTIIREIAHASGYNEEYFKQVVLKQDGDGIFPFWPHKVLRGKDDESVSVPKSESQLTKKEESELIDRLYAFAVEWSVELKDDR